MSLEIKPLQQEFNDNKSPNSLNASELKSMKDKFDNDPAYKQNVLDKIKNDDEFKNESIQFLKSFEKSNDYYNAMNVSKDVSLINDYNNLLFTLQGKNAFKFGKENAIEGPEQKFNKFIQMNVSTINVNNPATIAKIESELGPILKGLKNGTIEITSPDINIVGLTSDLPNVDSDGNNLNPALRQDRANVALGIFQNLLFKPEYSGINLPLVKTSTRPQPPGSYNPAVDINTDIPKFNDWHGVKFEFSYKTVTNTINLPKVNVKVQLESKTLDGQHLQVFRDLITDNFLTKFSPEVADQLRNLKSSELLNKNLANSPNLVAFYSYLNNPASITGDANKAINALNSTDEGKNALTLLKQELQNKEKELGGGRMFTAGGKQDAVYFGSLGFMEYNKDTKKYSASLDAGKTQSDLTTQANGWKSLNGENTKNDISDREQIFSTQSFLKMFFNENDLNAMGAKINGTDVDISHIPLDKLFEAHQKKQVDLLNKQGFAGGIIFDMNKFSADPSNYYQQQLAAIESANITLNDKQLLNTHINNVMLAEVNKQKFDRARKNGYV